MQPDAKIGEAGFQSRSTEPDGKVGLKTIFDHKDRILRALSYIENHLSHPLQADGVAKVACLSRYHFHRKFSYYTGSTVSDYIRNRRLAKAAALILASARSVTDIAFSMGYGTSEAFTKAFKRRYGCPPSKFKVRYAKRALTGTSNRLNLIVLKPLTESVDAGIGGIDAFWDLQEIMAEVQPDSLDSTWVSVFPDACYHSDNAPAYIVAFSSLRYAMLFPGAGTTFEKSPSGSHAVLHVNQNAFVYRKAEGLIPRLPSKSTKHPMRLPVGLRSILLAPD